MEMHASICMLFSSNSTAFRRRKVAFDKLREISSICSELGLDIFVALGVCDNEGFGT
jgi:hypothetical protein